ncbi:hypothetical protein DRO97_00540 [Archaeoglobales archaeon]|nr:MAG: hypothetical protein DRO97_00540 [Archaeoglobales archaeon]
MSKVIAVVALILLTIPANAAVIHGTIYSWETLEPVRKAIVTINTTPEQKIVSNGTYSFTVPNGTYVIKAFYKNDVELYAEENITIVEDRSYVIDLILFPKFEKIDEFEEIEFPEVEETINNYYLISIPILASILIYLYYLKRRERKFEVDEELPEDLTEVIEIIKKEGGRISQKELRKKLGYSEAKMSLIIADLERRDVVEKVKKGRGNIIFLKEKGD